MERDDPEREAAVRVGPRRLCLCLATELHHRRGGAGGRLGGVAEAADRGEAQAQLWHGAEAPLQGQDAAG